MHSLVSIGVMATCLCAAGGEPGLKVDKLYHGVGRPIMAELASTRSFGEVTLTLLDGEGNIIGESANVRPGRTDLAACMPRVWELRETTYLQMVVGDQSVGSALVLQPMLSRMVPVTERARREDGTPYLRVTDFEPESAEAERLRRELEGAPREEAAQDGSTNAAAADTRVFAGFRIYAEREAIMNTSLGDIRLAMSPEFAPNTAWNFLELSEGGFYDDIVFHRVVALEKKGRPFVIQAGDPTATGEGGPGYWLPMEPSALPHDFGVISMARDVQPDSAGSQFFIALSREGTERLDGQYCAFGYAIDGRETILAIEGVELADLATHRPKDPPVIKSIELVPASPRVPGSNPHERRVEREELKKIEEPVVKPIHVPR